MKISLPVVDRSRLKEGMGRCEHKRFLEYHLDSRGIKPKGQYVPLITGTAVHEAVGNILLNHNKPEMFQAIISNASANYRKTIEAKGFVAEEVEQATTLLQEQCWLVECLCWGFVKQYLPWILAEFDIICAEHEEILVIGCSCGLTEAELDTKLHKDRDCKGIALMSRPDLILRKKSSKELFAVDTKTTNDAGYSWRNSFEDNMQLGLQLVATENRLGEKIAGSYIIGIIKGKREEEDYKDPDSDIFQKSPFCYIYFKEDPFGDTEMQYAYDYVDEAGAKRKATKSKGYARKAVWSLEGPWSVDPKAWVDQMPEAILAAQFALLGPFPRPKQSVIDAMLAGIYGNEVRWNERLDALKKQGMEYVDFYFPKSWECRRYNNFCPYLAICNNELLEPIESGRFEYRIPHHEGEIK